MKYKLINWYPPYKKKDVGKIVWFGPNNLLGPENYPQFWELVVEKDYEILSLARLCSIKPTITDVSDYGDGYIEALLKYDKARIHSVKRLSDGEVFTIGDLVKCEDCKGKITSLEIYGNDIYLKGLYNNMPFGYTLCKALDCDEIPQKVKQPLFTTEDGVDIFEGDLFYYVKFVQYNNTLGKPFEIVRGDYSSFEYEPQYEKYFSTKEKAEEYVLMNKPVLSVNEVIDCFNNWSTRLTKKDWSETLKKRAQKLNNKN